MTEGSLSLAQRDYLWRHGPELLVRSEDIGPSDRQLMADVARSVPRIAVTYRLIGETDVAALIQMIQEFCAEQEILRTRLNWDERQGVTRVLGKPVVVELLTASASTVDTAISEFHSQPLDLFTTGLSRWAIITSDDGRTALAATISHTMTDQWSNWLMRRKVWAYHPSSEDASGRRRLLGYSEHVEREIAEASAVVDPIVGEFWATATRARTHISPDADGTPVAPGRLDGHVPSGQSSALGELAKRNEVSLPTLLMTAAAMMVARRSQQPEVQLQIYHHGRRSTSVFGTVGTFFRVLPLRLELPNVGLIKDFLDKTARQLTTAIERSAPPYCLEWAHGRAGIGARHASEDVDVRFNMLSTFSDTSQIGGALQMPPGLTVDPWYDNLSHWVNGSSVPGRGGVMIQPGNSEIGISVRLTYDRTWVSDALARQLLTLYLEVLDDLGSGGPGSRITAWSGASV